MWQTGLSHPADIEFDNTRRILWVCNNYRSEIVRFDMDQNHLGITAGFGDIKDICLSENDGGCWIAVSSEAQQTYEIWEIALSGEILVTIQGFAYITAVKADSSSGGCLAADAGNGSLIRISDQVEIFGENFSFYTPWDIAIE